MKLPLLSLLLASSLALVACTTPSTSASPGPDPIQAVANFTVADLQVADADAVASRDVIAHACYPALITFVNSQPSSSSNTTVVGAFSAFQKARDLRNVAAGGVPDYLTLGCGPLYAQVHGDILMFLGKAVGVGALPLPIVTP